MDKHIDVPVHLQIAGDIWRPESDDPHVRGGKLVGATQKRPTRPKPGTVLVKVTLRIPKAAFLPLRPEAVVVVPESMTEASPVVVEAENPSA